MTTRTHETSMGVKEAEKTKRDQILDDLEAAVQWFREHPEADISHATFFGPQNWKSEATRRSVEAMNPPDKLTPKGGYIPGYDAVKNFSNDVAYRVVVETEGEVRVVEPSVPDWLKPYLPESNQ